MGAGAMTRFPHLNAVFSTHVESLILCAEVRAGNGGDAVFAAITPISRGSGVTPLPSLAVGNTGHVGLSFEYEGEDAGTAGVRSTDCVAAGVYLRLCSGMSQYSEQENAELQPQSHSEINGNIHNI